MRVTNEQIRAEIICTQGDTCEGCPFAGIEDCTSLRGNGFDIYKDLLDAREIIKEMREFIDRIGIYQLDTIDQTERKFFLDRAKDYS